MFLSCPKGAASLELVGYSPCDTYPIIQAAQGAAVPNCPYPPPGTSVRRSCPAKVRNADPSGFGECSSQGLNAHVVVVVATRVLSGQRRETFLKRAQKRGQKECLKILRGFIRTSRRFAFPRQG
jgi:hypothetical protein